MDITQLTFENKRRYGVRRIHQELIHRGYQVNHKRVQRLMHEAGLAGKGNCYDNCIMETFFGRLKNEMYYGYEKDYSSFEEFSQVVEDYIEYYNNKRIQAKTKWMPPVKYREASMCSA